MSCGNKTSCEDKGKTNSDAGSGGAEGVADRATALVVVWRYRGHRWTYLWLGTIGVVWARSHTDQPPAVSDHVWSWIVHDEM